MCLPFLLVSKLLQFRYKKEINYISFIYRIHNVCTDIAVLYDRWFPQCVSNLADCDFVAFNRCRDLQMGKCTMAILNA